MKRIPLFLALALAVPLAHPSFAQTQIPAPLGWKIQTRDGARTFTPPDLKAGEKFSITVYDSAPLGGKTVGEYLRAFAGPVGKKVGQLAQPLAIQKDGEDFVRGTGIYVGPGGTVLGARFDSFSPDGANVSTLRIFTSHPTLLHRYADFEKEITISMARRAKKEAREDGGTSARNADDLSEGEAASRGWKAAPGRGVKDAQIAAIALDSRVSGTSEVNEKVYLLLKDGTIHADLPVPPDQFDAALSRQHEPNKWGRWRKVGGGYEVSWAGKPFEQLPCDIMLPAPRGIRLSGRYSTGRSSGMIGMGGSYSLWGVTFTPDGRFSKDRSGGASGANIYGADGSTFSTNMTYDDNGSSVVLGGPDVVGGVSQKNRNPKADREGAYFISGYTLTLRYDNGLVARWPFFFVDAQHKTLWFEDATLAYSTDQ